MPTGSEIQERDILTRDRNDSNRKLAPLKPADDAIRIDSSNRSAGQVVQAMLEKIRIKL